MSPGEPVVYRFIRFGKVRAAMPNVVAHHDDGLVALHLPIGARGRWSTSEGRPIRGQADREWRLREHVWHSRRVLHLIRPGDWYSLDLLWDASDAFVGWYVNIQEPLRQAPLGFDTDDLILDLFVTPDGRWSWKDEDELEQGVELGRFSAAEASAIRAVGEDVVARSPWPTGWEEWRPDPAWPLPDLPAGWDRV